jgi:hypothetical protein
MPSSSSTTSSSSAVARPSSDVHYHISDHLADRHPYGPGSQGSSGAIRTIQHSPVVDGFMNTGLDELLKHIQNKELDPIARAKSLRILLSRSLPAEAKIDMCKKGAVSVVADVLANHAAEYKGGLLPQGECFAAQILRSIAVVPAGAFAVVADGGLAALVKCVSNNANSSGTAAAGAQDRVAARAAALAAIQLLVSSWNSREWVLGILGEDEQMRVTPARSTSQADRDKLADETCKALVAVIAMEMGMHQLLVPATEALALLTTSPAGQLVGIKAKGMEACVNVCRKFSETGVNSTEEELAATSAATALWNMAMDATGKAKCTDLPLVKTLGKLLSVLLVTGGKFRLKAAVAGAIGAASIHVPVKLASIEKLEACMALPSSKSDMLMFATPTTLGRLVVLLQEANAAYAPLFAAKKANQLRPGEQATLLEELAAAIKNAVQAIRLIAEFPAARKEHLYPVLVPEGPEGKMLSTGLPLLLRRQLFYETDFHQEFRVPAV